MSIPTQYASHFLEERKAPSYTGNHADIPAERITHDQGQVDPKMVRPVQMDEFLRMCVSRRLLALSEGEIAALTAVMRQLGVGSQRGVEALVRFHQLISDEWASGTLDTP